MIIKIPIYLEIEEKFNPDQVAEINLSVQYLMSKELKEMHGGTMIFRLFGNKQLKFKILSTDQVRDRITRPGKEA